MAWTVERPVRRSTSRWLWSQSSASRAWCWSGWSVGGMLWSHYTILCNVTLMSDVTPIRPCLSCGKPSMPSEETVALCLACQELAKGSKRGVKMEQAPKTD